MIVDYLNIKGVAFIPHKADSPLAIDSDATLTAAISGKRLQSIPRRTP